MKEQTLILKSKNKTTSRIGITRNSSTDSCNKICSFFMLSIDYDTSKGVIAVTKNLANSKNDMHPTDVGAYLYLSFMTVI